MADFDLTQTDQQVQNILNDAQGAMGASAQTTLTTEYVMLKDTNGVYHKILKSSFTEAIRDVLAGLLVNNDKGTTISQIAAIASGDFGSITPANLASVLGGIALSNNGNFSSFARGAVTHVGSQSTATDKPVSSYTYWEVYTSPTVDGFQFAWSVEAKKPYIRGSQQGSQGIVWQQWNEIQTIQI